MFRLFVKVVSSIAVKIDVDMTDKKLVNLELKEENTFLCPHLNAHTCNVVKK